MNDTNGRPYPAVTTSLPARAISICDSLLGTEATVWLHSDPTKHLVLCPVTVLENGDSSELAIQYRPRGGETELFRRFVEAGYELIEIRGEVLPLAA